VIIEAETDNEARTQMDIRDIIRNKEKGTVTPVSFLFTKKGRISFEAGERNLTADDVLDEAIEAGAEDVEDDGEGGLVVWTEAGNTSAAADTLQKSLNLKVASSDIIWDANEDTKVPINDSIAKSISTFLDRLEEEPTVQAVYTNVAQGETNDDLWEDLVSKLEA
jgi:transcriptional/translational regulatory protein YebC/TACO1